MKTAVRYVSRGGNTEKIAHAIAKAIGTAAKSVDTPLSGPVDMLFLGGAIYAGKPDKRLAAFVRTLTKDAVKRIVVFSTSADGKPLLPKLKALLEERGITVSDETFACAGKFLFANREKPSETDCEEAAQFAKKLTAR